MVANLVKVISIMSLYLLCNSISSPYSGPAIEVNGIPREAIPITTLSPLEKEPVTVSPVTPDVNPTDSTPGSSTSSTEEPSTTPNSTTSSSTTTTTTVTPPPAPTPPTAAPAPPVTPPVPAPTPSADSGRHFDGPSFIGGIVLAAGLSCISFIGIKVYRARTERNYHTL